MFTNRWLACIGLVACLEVQGSSIPGTRFKVDWPRLISASDVIVTAPLPDVNHGLRLGNGDLGISVYGSPNLLTFHVGKNDLWDYRDAMEGKKLRTHQDFLAHYTNSAKPPIGPGYLTALDDPWNQDIRQTYIDPAPSMKPAGQIRFRNASVSGTKFNARLSLWDAELSATLGDQKKVEARAFVSYARDLMVIEYNPTEREEFDIELARHQDATGLISNAPEFGAAGREMWVRYRFPADPLNYPNGFEYVMCARVLGGESVATEIITNFATITQWVWEKGQPKTREGVAVAHMAA